MKGIFPVDRFQGMRTPFYYYDAKVLRDTLACLRTEAGRYDNFSVHPRRAAGQAGVPAANIAVAGVGKAAWEMPLGQECDIS